MRKAPAGFTKKEFRVRKRREFDYLKTELDLFLENINHTPVPYDVINDLLSAIDDVEYYIGTVSWGH